MDIAIFVIFLLTDLSIVGIFAAVYGGKHSYRGGMILGVHLPEYAAEDKDVTELVSHFRKTNRIFYAVNLLAGTGAAFLYFGRFSIFIIVWSLWLAEFCLLSSALLFRAHRRMYDLKTGKKWVVGEPVKTVIVDTSVSSVSDKLPFSHWWHLPAILLSAAGLLFLPQIREYFGNDAMRWILSGAVLSMEVMFWAVHIWYSRRENTVYSSDSRINLAVNRLTKRVWSGMWIICNYLLLLSMAVLLIPLSVHGSIKLMNWFFFLTLQTALLALVTGAILWLEKKRGDILSKDREPLLVDDDLYWKNGWYSNPGDKRLFVQDRMCSANFTMNMAKPAAKITTGLFGAGTLILLVWICAIFVRMDFIEPELVISSTDVEITAGMYDISFSKSDILDVELLDGLPQEKLHRTNGADTSEYLLGKFKGEKTGECRLYIYKNYQPVLAIRLPGYTIFINSRTPGTTDGWYDSLHISP